MNINVSKKRNIFKLVFTGLVTTDEARNGYRRRTNPLAWFRDNLGPESPSYVDARPFPDKWWTYYNIKGQLVIRVYDCPELTQYLLIHSNLTNSKITV